MRICIIDGERGKMSRELTTCEEIGTVIYHRSRPSVGRIVGSYRGGFVVDVLEGQKGKCVLPFENLKGWAVEEE